MIDAENGVSDAAVRGAERVAESGTATRRVAIGPPRSTATYRIFGPRPEADYLSVGGWETRPTKQPVCIRDRADRRLVEGTGGVGGGVENGGGVSGGRRLKAEVDLEEGEMWKVEGDS